MAKGKKTIEVDALLEYANAQLARKDKYADVGFMSGIATMIERVLLDTDNYNGYCYLDPNDCEVGTVGYYSRKYFKK